MPWLLVCAFSFCTNVFGGEHADLYDSEVKADNLQILNRVNVHGISLLHDEIQLYVKLSLETELTHSYDHKLRDVLQQLRLATKRAEQSRKHPAQCMKTYRAAARKVVSTFIPTLEPCVDAIDSEFVDLTERAAQAKDDAIILQHKLDKWERVIRNCNEEQECFKNEIDNFEKEYDRIRIIHGELLQERVGIFEKVPKVVDCIRNHNGNINEKMDEVLQEGLHCIENS